jgi:hypothetical protein
MPLNFTYLPLFRLPGLVSIHLASCGKWPVIRIWVGAFLLGLSAAVVGSLRYGHFLTIGNQDLRNAAEIPKIANTGKGIYRGAIRATCAVVRRGSTGREKMQLTRTPMGLGLRAGM